jgi:hypothetical protein
MQEHLQSASIEASTENPGDILHIVPNYFFFLPSPSAFLFLARRMVAFTFSLEYLLGAVDNTNVLEGNRTILPDQRNTNICIHYLRLHLGLAVLSCPSGYCSLRV